ncbi:RNA demethylase ALKBH9B-like [Phragmites australis]|uniref:RNA demethylase ALKBH9B-like n=1 Tax=Phragmites australis TaxID=29695 RepID=UPI002D766E28|nr:RNA demethylase ALKBH9B-like [Phragmites australis]
MAAAAMSNQPAEGMQRVRRKKDFTHMERVDGRMTNILQGLELHTGVFSPADQQRIVDCVHDLQDKGRRGLLRERTYSEPRKWMRGKGRATIQFGCCYNYATDRNGNPPGIIRDEEVDPLPPLLTAMIRRLVEWRVLPPSLVPDSCIVNIYDVDDCIPPHIDHHDFLRPFCTVSFLAECSILFGRDLRVLGPGEFAGSASISLPVGSVLVLKGNGADVAKHCVPAVPAKRISITFRKMDASKLPFKFRPDPELKNLAPLPYPAPVRPPASNDSPVSSTPRPQQQQAVSVVRQGPTTAQGPGAFQYQAAVRAGQVSASGGAFSLSSDDFPALGASPATATASRGNRGRR